ncbi:MAG TPA: hypothetical protein VGF96_19810 [Terracidiphilus sp.]
MILPLLQMATATAVAVYLYCWRAGVRHRNAQSWESLLSRLQPDWGAPGVSDQFLCDNWLEATPEENWKRIHGTEGLWAMYQNTRVMLEMANYAARNTASIDQALLANLRRDGLQIRGFILKAFLQYVFKQADEKICVNALCATSMYTEMATRMTRLMQINFGGMLPALLF